MAHPDVQAVGQPGEQRAADLDRRLGPAELAEPGPRHVAAERPGHGLEAVADAEGRQPGGEQAGSTWGAPSAYTDCGPPDRIIAFGRLATISATLAVCGTISE